MYLAPLNYDRFFKKVFKDKKVSKAFLEDFLDIKITKLEILENKQHITDAGIPVEFDYRCELSTGEKIIIEMQQWYKTDIIRRFYLYHSLSTSIQLESIKEQVVGLNPKTQKVIKDKIYNDVKPVITLIWMVDDNLNFDEDFITYQMAVKKLNDFVKNDDLWSKSFESLLEERKYVLNLENNDTKGLDFISENKLTFIFQQNIVKNNKNNEKLKKYVKWFNFALKTKNQKNKKQDFKEFENDKLFVGIMNRLIKNKLTEDEIKYITDAEEFQDAYFEYTARIMNMKKEVEEKQKEVEEKQKEVEDKQKEVEDKQKEVEDKQKEVEDKQKEVEDKQKEVEEKNKALINTVKLLLNLNTPIDKIKEATGLSAKEIEKILN
jgi:hypothetical protein